MLKIKYSKIYSCALFGINGVLVEIEVSIHPGLSVFEIVGLGDCAVRESRNRVRAAIRNNGYEFPAGRIIVGMAPGFIRKEGTAYDLPIAIGILSASGQIGVIPKDVCIVGEMSLSGDVKSIPGTINRILTASQGGYQRIIIPYLNVAEGSFVKNIEIFGVCTLKEVIGLFDGKSKWKAIKTGDISPDPQSCNIKDISTIIGQPFAVRALIVIARFNCR
jgi:magnesium chelatase family protein